jgi:phosphoserine phosphatase
VQSETLPEGGHYAINPWFAHVVKVPTRNLILEWTTKAAKSSTNLDISLDQIVLDVQGYTVRLDMKQTLRIPASAAPYLVRTFGDRVRRGRNTERTPVQEFVEKQLAATVTGYFRRIAAHATILEFITKYDELSVELFREVHDALALSGIEGVATTLEEFTCEPRDMNELRRSIALERHKVHSLEAVLSTSRLAAEIEQTKIDVEAARRRLELVQIQGLVELLGPAQVATERILAEWVKMGVPHTIVSGGNDEMARSIMEAMPFTQARDMLLAMASESGRRLAAPEQQQQLSTPEQQQLSAPEQQAIRPSEGE